MTNRAEPRLIGQILPFVALGSLCTHFVAFMFPVVAITIARELKLPITTVLSWGFAGYVLFGLGALPGGWLSDAIGGRRVLLVGLAGTGVAALAAAEAAPGRSLAVCLGALGLFAGFHRPAAIQLIDCLDEPWRARGRLVQRLAAGLGVALAPVITLGAASQFGSRQVYTVTGFSVCALSAVLGLWRTAMDDAVLSANRTQSPRSTPPVTVYVLLSLAIAAAGIGTFGQFMLQPSYFAHRLPPATAGLAVSVVYGLGVIGSCVGELNIGERTGYWSHIVLQFGAGVALVLMGHTEHAWLLVVATVAALCGLFSQALAMDLIERMSARSGSATADGGRFAFIACVNALAVPLATWVATASDNLAAAFPWLGLITAGAAAGFAVIARLALPAAPDAIDSPSSERSRVTLGEPVV